MSKRASGFARRAMVGARIATRTVRDAAAQAAAASRTSVFDKSNTVPSLLETAARRTSVSDKSDMRPSLHETADHSGGFDKESIDDRPQKGRGGFAGGLYTRGEDRP
jgi:hypothetical protein